MDNLYVEQRNDAYWIAGTRVSLDSIVYAFQQGQTAESIAQSFPAVSLERVYGAIAFYLAHQGEVDQYLTRASGARAKLAHESHATPSLYQR